MRKEQIIDALNYLEDEIIEETDAIRQKKAVSSHKKSHFALVAASFSLILLGGYAISSQNFYGNDNSSSEILSESESLLDKEETSENTSISNEKATLSIDDGNTFILTADTIFCGTISEISPTSTNTESISPAREFTTIDVQIQEVYLGKLQPKNTVSLQEGISSDIAVGTSGIFIICDDKHFSFLETNNGLLFDQKFSSIFSASDSLNDVESYIQELLKNQEN